MWQIYRTKAGIFKMINAYYDDRDFYKREKKAVVKVLAYSDNPFPEIKLFCQLWYDNNNESIEIEAELESLYNWKQRNEKTLKPFLIVCSNPLMNQGLVPSSVSIVENQADVAKNNFQIIYKPPESRNKKPFAPCLKLFDYQTDKSRQLIEFVEIWLILGADKVLVNAFKVHQQIKKVLKFYESVGKVKLSLMTLPKGTANILKSGVQLSQNDNMAYTDCFYKNMYDYSFIIPIDFDELIVPTKPDDKNLIDTLDRILANGKKLQTPLFSTYEARHTLFLLNNKHKNEIQPEVPKDFLFLQKVFRSNTVHAKHHAAKSFLNTEIVCAMNQHFAFRCNGTKACDRFEIDMEEAKMQHYRHDLPADKVIFIIKCSNNTSRFRGDHTKLPYKKCDRGRGSWNAKKSVTYYSNTAFP